MKFTLGRLIFGSKSAPAKLTTKPTAARDITFKCRAECAADAVRFFQLLPPDALKWVYFEPLITDTSGIKFPDVAVSFRRAGWTLDRVRAVMASVTDGHVM